MLFFFFFFTCNNPHFLSKSRRNCQNLSWWAGRPSCRKQNKYNHCYKRAAYERYNLATLVGFFIVCLWGNICKSLTFLNLHCLHHVCSRSAARPCVAQCEISRNACRAVCTQGSTHPNSASPQKHPSMNKIYIYIRMWYVTFSTTSSLYESSTHGGSSCVLEVKNSDVVSGLFFFFFLTTAPENRLKPSSAGLDEAESGCNRDWSEPTIWHRHALHSEETVRRSPQGLTLSSSVVHVVIYNIIRVSFMSLSDLWRIIASPSSL